MDTTMVAKGKWNQIKGEVKRQWGELTDDQMDQIDGDFDKMVGIIQEQYGKSKDEAEQEVRDFKNQYFS